MLFKCKLIFCTTNEPESLILSYYGIITLLLYCTTLDAVHQSSVEIMSSLKQTRKKRRLQTRPTKSSNDFYMIIGKIIVIPKYYNIYG